MDLLRGGPLSVGDLAAAFPEFSRYAIMQHLGVLEEARLVIPVKQGRTVLNHLNAAPLREVYERWVGAFEGHWAEALVGLKRTLEATPEDHAAASAKTRGRPRSASHAAAERQKDEPHA